jgi:hypothetical protein
MSGINIQVIQVPVYAAGSEHLLRGTSWGDKAAGYDCKSRCKACAGCTRHLFRGTCTVQVQIHVQDQLSSYFVIGVHTSGVTHTMMLTVDM